MKFKFSKYIAKILSFMLTVGGAFAVLNVGSSCGYNACYAVNKYVADVSRTTAAVKNLANLNKNKITSQMVDEVLNLINGVLSVKVEDALSIGEVKDYLSSFDELVKSVFFGLFENVKFSGFVEKLGRVSEDLLIRRHEICRKSGICPIDRDNKPIKTYLHLDNNYVINNTLPQSNNME